MLRNHSSHYGIISVLLHWSAAIVIVGLFAVGYWMVDLSYYSSWYRTAPHWHKSIGIVLLLLMILRLLWRVISISPAPVVTHSKWERVSSKLAHMLLYAGVFAIIVTGYLISTADGRAIQVFNWFEVPGLGELFSQQADIAGDLHRYFAYAVIALAVLHAAAAVKHHVIDKDPTLKRMLGRKN